MAGVISIFLIVAVGFLASKRGHLSADFEKSLAKLSSTYAIPALIFHNTVTQLSAEFLVEKLGWYMLLPFVVILLGYALARLLALTVKLPKEEYGAMSTLFSMSNVIFIGLPVCLAVFGSWSTPYVVSFFPANTILFWTVGNLGMLPKNQFKGREIIKQIVSPPLIAFIVGIIFVLLEIELPAFFLSAAQMLGAMGTPVALLIVGGVLSRTTKQLWHIPKMVGMVMLGRSIVMPVMMYAACRLVGAPLEITLVYTTVSAMPVMSQAVLLARRYNCCVDNVAHAFAVTTLCSLVCVPLVILLLQLLTGFVNVV